MKVLVTGGTGFAGGAVVRRLIARGDEVHVLARDLEAPAAKALAGLGARLHRGSVGDPNQVLAAASGCALVVHAAAIRSHKAAPRALAWTNVAGTENVINAARHARVGRVVHV